MSKKSQTPIPRPATGGAFRCVGGTLHPLEAPANTRPARASRKGTAPEVPAQTEPQNTEE